MKSISFTSYRLWLLGIAAVSGIGLLLSDWILRSTTCPPQYDSQCEHFTDVVFALNSGFFLESIIVTTLLLMLFPQRAFIWWRWFALMAIPYGVWGIAGTKSVDTFFTAQTMSNVGGAIFLGVSLLIAISATAYDHTRSRKTLAGK